MFIPKKEDGTVDALGVVVDEVACGAGTGAAGAANKAGEDKNKIKIRTNKIAVAFNGDLPWGLKARFTVPNLQAG